MKVEIDPSPTGDVWSCLKVLPKNVKGKGRSEVANSEPFFQLSNTEGLGTSPMAKCALPFGTTCIDYCSICIFHNWVQ